jgi:hypothetical protein
VGGVGAGAVFFLGGVPVSPAVGPGLSPSQPWGRSKLHELTKTKKFKERKGIGSLLV